MWNRGFGRRSLLETASVCKRLVIEPVFSPRPCLWQRWHSAVVAQWLRKPLLSNMWVSHPLSWPWDSMEYRKGRFSHHLARPIVDRQVGLWVACFLCISLGWNCCLHVRNSPFSLRLVRSMYGLYFHGLRPCKCVVSSVFIRTVFRNWSLLSVQKYCYLFV